MDLPETDRSPLQDYTNKTQEPTAKSALKIRKPHSFSLTPRAKMYIYKKGEGSNNELGP